MTSTQRKEDLGAIIVKRLVTPKTFAGIFMENLLIGNQEGRKSWTPYYNRRGFHCSSKWSIQQRIIGNSSTVDAQAQQTSITQNTTTSAIATMAQKDNFFTALKVKRVDNNGSWIVDSRASGHMTSDISFIQDFQPCYENYTVSIVDDSISKVFGTSSVTLFKNLTLESVLLVPKLDCNLLSISLLAQEKIVTKFFPTHCVFQDLNSE